MSKIIDLLVKNAPLQDIIKCGKDEISEKDKSGTTALHWAIQMRRFDVVRYLLKQDIDIDTQDSNGNTALHLAIAKQDLKGSLLLLEYQAKHLPNNALIYPLHLSIEAFENDDADLFNLLQISSQNGADFGVIDQVGNTPLLLAVETWGPKKTFFIYWLCGLAPEVAKKPNNQGKTVFMSAEEKYPEALDFLLLLAVATENKEALLQLHHKNQMQGGLTAIKGFRDCTVWIFACVFGRVEILHWLLETFPEHKQQFPQQKTEKGFLGWNLAAVYGHKEVILWLCKQFPDYKFLLEKDPHGNTAWLEAAIYGQVKMMNCLLETFPENKQQFLQEKTKDGKTAWLLAVRFGQIKVMLWLMETFPEHQFLQEKDKNENTTWLTAALYGQVQVMAWLLEKFPQNIKLFQQEKNIYKNTASLHAALFNHVEVLEYLLQIFPKNKQYLLEKNKYDSTAWLQAASNAGVEVMQWLWKTFPENQQQFLQEKDKDEKTAWLLAAGNGGVKVMQWLWKTLPKNQQQFLQEKTKDGKTAWLLAAASQVEVLKWLWETFPKNQQQFLQETFNTMLIWSMISTVNDKTQREKLYCFWIPLSFQWYLSQQKISTITDLKNAIESKAGLSDVICNLIVKECSQTIELILARDPKNWEDIWQLITYGMEFDQEHFIQLIITIAEQIVQGNESEDKKYFLKKWYDLAHTLKHARFDAEIISFLQQQQQYLDAYNFCKAILEINGENIERQAHASVAIAEMLFIGMIYADSTDTISAVVKIIPEITSKDNEHTIVEKKQQALAIMTDRVIAAYAYVIEFDLAAAKQLLSKFNKTLAGELDPESEKTNTLWRAEVLEKFRQFYPFEKRSPNMLKILDNQFTLLLQDYKNLKQQHNQSSQATPLPETRTTPFWNSLNQEKLKNPGKEEAKEGKEKEEEKHVSIFESNST